MNTLRQSVATLDIPRFNQKILSIRREPMLIDFLTLSLTVHVESSGSSYILSGTYRESTHCCYYCVYCYMFYIMCTLSEWWISTMVSWDSNLRCKEQFHYSAIKNVNTIWNCVYVLCGTVVMFSAKPLTCHCNEKFSLQWQVNGLAENIWGETLMMGICTLNWWLSLKRDDV